MTVFAHAASLTPPLSRRKQLARWAALAGLCLISSLTAAADESPTVIGKNDWLFFRYERIDPKHRDNIDATLRLVQKANRLFADNGIQLVVSITPLKMRLYADQLPNDFSTYPDMVKNHDRIVGKLREAGVVVADQQSAFLAKVKADPGTQLYLRLDSHWTPAGALLAADTIRTTIDSSPKIAALLQSLPAATYQITHNPQPVVWRARDLLRTLPKGTAALTPERIPTYDVSRSGPQSLALQGNDSAPRITLIGSSFVARGTQFPAAVRYALQHDILDISIPGRQGPWVGMENYLGDPAFQTVRPQLIIWEIPERDTPNPPNSPWREAEYRRDENEWLQHIAALVAKQCQPASQNAVQIAPSNLPNFPQRNVNGGLSQGISNADSYVELKLEQPTLAQDYLIADMTLQGEGNIRFEAISGNGKVTGWSSLFPGDGNSYPLKLRLPAAARDAQQLRIFPGEASAFSLAAPRVCQLRSEWLN